MFKIKLAELPAPDRDVLLLFLPERQILW